VRAHLVVEGGDEATEVEFSRGSRFADARARKPRSKVVGFIVLDLL